MEFFLLDTLGLDTFGLGTLEFIYLIGTVLKLFTLHTLLLIIYNNTFMLGGLT